MSRYRFNPLISGIVLLVAGFGATALAARAALKRSCSLRSRSVRPSVGIHPKVQLHTIRSASPRDANTCDIVPISKVARLPPSASLDTKPHLHFHLLPSSTHLHRMRSHCNYTPLASILCQNEYAAIARSKFPFSEPPHRSLPFVGECPALPPRLNVAGP